MKNVFQSYKDKNDKCEDEVENVLQTYRELIDTMGKVSLSHSRWENQEKHEKVIVLVAPYSKLKNSTTVVHHFSSWIDLDRCQNLKICF